MGICSLAGSEVSEGWAENAAVEVNPSVKAGLRL